jgi:hypothetical protein
VQRFIHPASPATLSPGQHAVSSIASLSPKPRPAGHFAGLLVIFPSTHLLFDTTSFHEFPETPDGFLNALAVPDQKLYHSFYLVLSCQRNDQGRLQPKSRNRLESNSIHRFSAFCPGTHEAHSPPDRMPDSDKFNYPTCRATPFGAPSTSADQIDTYERCANLLSSGRLRKTQEVQRSQIPFSTWQGQMSDFTGRPSASLAPMHPWVQTTHSKPHLCLYRDDAVQPPPAPDR